MSKVGKLTAFLEGLHVMGRNGLRDYHAAAAAVNANRKRDTLDKLAAVKAALKNHRVTVKVRCGDISVTRTTDGDGNTLACPQSWHLNG